MDVNPAFPFIFVLWLCVLQHYDAYVVLHLKMFGGLSALGVGDKDEGLPARLGEWPETHAFVVGIVFIAVPCDGGGELHEQFLLGKTAVGHQAQGSCVGEGSEVARVDAEYLDEACATVVVLWHVQLALHDEQGGVVENCHGWYSVAVVFCSMCGLRSVCPVGVLRERLQVCSEALQAEQGGYGVVDRCARFYVVSQPLFGSCPEDALASVVGEGFETAVAKYLGRAEAGRHFELAQCGSALHVHLDDLLVVFGGDEDRVVDIYYTFRIACAHISYGVAVEADILYVLYVARWMEADVYFVPSVEVFFVADKGIAAASDVGDAAVVAAWHTPVVEVVLLVELWMRGWL